MLFPQTNQKTAPESGCGHFTNAPIYTATQKRNHTQSDALINDHIQTDIVYFIEHRDIVCLNMYSLNLCPQTNKRNRGLNRCVLGGGDGVSAPKVVPPLVKGTPGKIHEIASGLIHNFGSTNPPDFSGSVRSDTNMHPLKLCCGHYTDAHIHEYSDRHKDTHTQTYTYTRTLRHTQRHAHVRTHTEVMSSDEHTCSHISPQLTPMLNLSMNVKTQ